MDSTHTSTSRLVWRLIVGFLATLLFHRLILALLWRLGVAAFVPFPMRATWPFSIPAVWSLAFWSSIWGILFALVERHFPHNAYWTLAFIFGALLPSLAAFRVILPLKEQSVESGCNWKRLLTAFLSQRCLGREHWVDPQGAIRQIQWSKRTA